MSTNINPTPTATDPPIHKLNIDILSKIFWTNTDIFPLFRPSDPSILDPDGNVIGQTRPLIVLRRTSQVCREWRAIILGSPILWGRVIELNLLEGGRRPRWGEEILARAGQSPLHIVGIDVQPEFFTEILAKRWSMVERMAVAGLDIAEDSIMETYGQQIWNHLQQPAPCLKVFDLSFRYRNVSISLNPRLSLFGNNAPRLRDFSIVVSPGMQISLQGSWVKDLRSLSIVALITPLYEATTFVRELLSNIPHLEHLSVERIFFPTTHEDCKRVSLPSLKMLVIGENFESSLFLFRHIIAPSACALSLRVDCSFQVSDANMSDICKEISRYANGCLASLAEQNLLHSLGLVTSHSKNILFAAQLKPDFPFGLDTQLNIFFNTVHAIRGLPLLVIAILIDHLNFSLFATHIKKFCLLIRELDPSRLAEAYKPRLNAIGSLCASLSSVTFLEATVSALNLLVGVGSRDYDVFPSLETLEVKERPPWQFDDAVWFHGIIANFLNGRLAKGRRLLILDISDCLTENKQEWGYLEAFNGMKVVWGLTGSKSEYICGSGEPRKIGATVPAPRWDLDDDQLVAR